MRIVSLLASATEIVCELGLEDLLVGISHECDHPPEVLNRPRVSSPAFDPNALTSGQIDHAVRDAVQTHGSVYRIDADALADLDPHLLLTQAVCEVCAVPTDAARQAIDDAKIGCEILSLDAHSLRDILDTIQQVGEATGMRERADEVVERLRRRLHDVTRSVAGASRPSVLALEWLDPIFLPGHWVPEMIDLAGGELLVGDAKERSREVGREALLELDPDVLLVMPCGYGLSAARRDADAHADLLMAVGGRAVEEGRAFVVDASSYFNRSGPRVVDGIEILAGLLHPELTTVRQAGAAATWIAPAIR